MKQDHILDPFAEEVLLEAAEQSYGEPEYNRRLSDKVLAAFNHAYASGEREIAQRLRAILAEVEERLRKLDRKPRANGAMDEAEKWTRFVDARDRYRSVKDDPRFAASAVGEALAEMKEAFKSWSLT